ncbi:MAG TPA: nuclear transport factor 2 family protein [Nitriliruptorales bacterium]
MGRAREVWERLVQMWEAGDVSDLPELYTADALYLEPYNPPHNGNLLIQAYLKDYLAGKDDLSIEVKRLFEDADGGGVAVEWTLSYTAGGRRWNDLPRATFLGLDDDGMVTYHRDYF